MFVQRYKHFKNGNQPRFAKTGIYNQAETAQVLVPYSLKQNKPA
jgi:hypothetical protein